MPNAKKAKERETRRLASKIPDQETFDRILSQVGVREKSEVLRDQMRQAVRASLIPYLKFELKGVD
jgi:hypothetical protein